MRIIDTKEIEDCVYRLALKAGIRMIPSCKKAMREASEKESSEACKFALDTLLENAEVAANEAMPICQDTGMSVVLMEIGQEVSLQGKLLIDAVNEGVRRAYQDGYFRKSVCDPLTRVNTADNTPAVLHTDIVAGDKVNITFLPKGFGSENMSRLYMLTPAKGVKGVIDSIVETVKIAG
ncbi:MAG: fumarate hydratase, partial [Clostridia bacterium]|nr:fumarate hydratase [Clostridia bacterium]